MTAVTLALGELRAADAAHVAAAGRKAAVLGELIRAGFRVPPGFVLSAAVAPGDPAAEVPEAVREALAAGLATLPGVVAVRSSAIAEDLAGRSFAGQYDSVLNVEGLDAVVDAVRVCWASVFGERIRAYHGPAVGGRMAVLVQAMAPAQVSGVAFSANPVTGDRAEVVISAVPGLADGLADGRVTPEEWSVCGTSAVRTGGDLGALDAAAALAVAETAREIAAVRGAPQDIEWTWADGEVWVVQARPITALPDPPPELFEDAPGDGFWLRGNYSLQPLSPMNVGTILRAVNLASPELFRYALGERIEVRSVRGWSYVRFVPLAGPDAAVERLTRIAGALREDQPLGTVQRWRESWHEEAVHALDARRDVALADLPDDGLLREIAGRHAAADEAQRRHMLIGGASSVELGPLGLLCERELNWPVGRVLELLTGLPGMTTEPARGLDALVALAMADAPLAMLLSTPGEGTWERIETDHPGFAKSARGYLREHGLRCLGADIAEPTMAERPLLLLRLIAEHLNSGTRPSDAVGAAAATRRVAEEAARCSLPRRRQADFERALRRAQDAYPLREDTAYFCHTAWGLLRMAVLELGSRLRARGQLAEDIFLLTLDEACAALASGVSCQDRAQTRRAGLAWAAGRMGPQTLGQRQGPPATLDQVLPLLSGELGAELASLRWVDAAYTIGTQRVEQSGTVLRGVGAAAGRYTGRVKVLRGEADFHKLGHGDVLVCPETTAQWSVLFSNVGALVADTGGLLSHPAIIAREYRVPAVVATGNATALLRDGQLVTVDGGSGLVEVIEDD
jgi:rifampicin phosphotransferase